MALGPGTAARLRAALDVHGFPHTYVRTPVTLGAEDPEGNATRVPGTPVTGLRCRYRSEQSVQQDQTRRDTAGWVNISLPRVLIPHDSELQTGDLVSAITDSEGGVLLAGPLLVEDQVINAAFGFPTSRVAYLRAGDVR